MSKKLIKCNINNQEIEVLEGTSIIEAFKQLDQPIAHYCWHPGLSVAGGVDFVWWTQKDVSFVPAVCGLQMK